MKFFEAQKYDEIGQIGVKLQKVLILLSILNIVGICSPSPVAWMSTLLTGLLIIIGFRGAVKRREREVRLYYVVSLTLLVFMITLTILSLFLFVAVAKEEQNIEMTKPHHIPSVPVPSQQVEPNKPTQALLGAPKHSLTESSQSEHEIIRTHVAPTEVVQPLPLRETVVNIPVVILYAVFTMFFVALKVVSIGLAGKMSQMLRESQAQHLAHPMTTRQLNANTELSNMNIVYIPIPQQMETSSSAPHLYAYPHIQHPTYFNPQMANAAYTGNHQPHYYA